MYIGKGSICVLHMVWWQTRWTVPFEFDCEMRRNKQNYFPNLSPRRIQFQATTLKMWLNTTINRVKGTYFNALRPRQNGRHFADDTFKRIFLKENVRILLKISMKFVPKVRINNIPALVQAWRRPGDKPLSEPMLVRLPTHICVTRPQWVKVDPTKK